MGYGKPRRAPPIVRVDAEASARLVLEREGPALYLASSFTWHDYPDAAKKEQLVLWGSADGVHWTPITRPGEGYTPDYGEGRLRDPNIMRHNDRWYIVHTKGHRNATDDGWVDYSDARIIVSDDLLTWEFVADVESGSSEVWAPKWFKDTDGSIYLVLGHRLAKALNDDLTSWDTPTEMSGAPAGIDRFLVRADDGTYHLFGRAAEPDATFRATATDPYGPYTLQDANVGSWGAGYEGIVITRLPSGTYRAYLDQTGSTMKYAESDDLETWTALTDMNVLLHHGGVLPVQDLKGAHDLLSVMLRGAFLYGSDSTLQAGQKAIATGARAIAIGESSRATTDSATAVGNTAKATGSAATALGINANASGADSFAIGRASVASGMRGAAIGNNAQAAGQDSIAIGYRPEADGSNSIAIGTDANRNLTAGNNSVAVGAQTQATSSAAVAVGAAAVASNQNATALGNGATATGYRSTAVGFSAQATAEHAAALGREASATHASSVALGHGSATQRANSVSVGAKDIEVTDATKGLILRSPDGSVFRVTVGDDGVLVTTEL